MARRKQSDSDPNENEQESSQVKPTRGRRKRKKSVHGSGSVFPRKDGRWVARLLVEETGKYKDLYAHSEKEAYQLLENARFQQKQGVLATGPQQTVKQFLEYWLEDVEKPVVRLSTYTNARVVVHKHLIPGIGHIQLRKLTARHLQSFYAKKLKEGTSASRVDLINAVLHKALVHARRIKLVGTNVSEDVDLPTPPSPERQPLTPDQARLFLQRIKGHDLEVLLTLAITTAMRKGEILGLRWSDIDFEKGALHIQRTLNYIAGHGFVEGDPKTPKSKREIIVPSFVLEVLKRYRVTQEGKRLQAGPTWIDRDLVFCDDRGGFIHPNTLSNRFYRVLREIHLPRIHFHDLRHSAATLLLSMGVPEKVIQGILGHSTNSETSKYTHSLPSMQKEAMEKIDGFFNA